MYIYIYIYAYAFFFFWCSSLLGKHLTDSSKAGSPRLLVTRMFRSMWWFFEGFPCDVLEVFHSTCVTPGTCWSILKNSSSWEVPGCVVWVILAYKLLRCTSLFRREWPHARRPIAGNMGECNETAWHPLAEPGGSGRPPKVAANLTASTPASNARPPGTTNRLSHLPRGGP